MNTITGNAIEKQREIPSQLCHLCSEINDLHDLIAKLADKLAPVTIPAPPDPQSEVGCNTYTEYGTKIFGCVQRVGEAKEKVAKLLCNVQV